MDHSPTSANTIPPVFPYVGGLPILTFLTLAAFNSVRILCSVLVAHMGTGTVLGIETNGCPCPARTSAYMANRSSAAPARNAPIRSHELGIASHISLSTNAWESLKNEVISLGHEKPGRPLALVRVADCAPPPLDVGTLPYPTILLPHDARDE